MTTETVIIHWYDWYEERMTKNFLPSNKHTEFALSLYNSTYRDTLFDLTEFGD
jgi:hypothetical protein